MTPDKPRPQLFDGDRLNEQELFRRTGLRAADLNTGEMKYRLKSGEVVKGNLRRVFKECPHVPQAIEDAFAAGGIDGVKSVYKGMELMHGLKEGTLEISQDTIALHDHKKKIEERPTLPENTTPHQPGETPVAEQPVLSAPVLVEPTTPAPHPVTLQEESVHVALPTGTDTHHTSVDPGKPSEQRVIPKEPLIPHIFPDQLVPKTAEQSGKPVEKAQSPRAENADKGKQEVGSESTRRTLVFEKSQPEVAAPALEHMTKEQLVVAMVATIDAFLEKDIPDASDVQKTTASLIKKDGAITLGVLPKAKDTALGAEIQAEPTLKPVSTADELIQMLDILNKLSIEDLFPRGTQTDGQNISGAESTDTMYLTLPTEERRGQQEKPSPLSLLVSEDVLHFLENGKALFEQLEKKEPKEEAAPQESSQRKNPVRIISGDKEILIELEMLKKLIELVKVRKQMKERSVTAEQWAFPEELNLHGLSYQDNPDDAFMLLMYQTMIAPFITEDNATQNEEATDRMRVASHQVFTA